jgi:hypothetical protein
VGFVVEEVALCYIDDVRVNLELTEERKLGLLNSESKILRLEQGETK